jgi:hypothetical protein
MSKSSRAIVGVILGLAVTVVGAQSKAATISGATKISGNATPINLLSGGLAEGVLAYTDRTHVLVNIPDDIEGGDLVQVSNSDKESNPYQVDVTVGNLGILYVGLDDRSVQPRPWMDDPGQTGLPSKFFNTGAKVDIDESADGDVDQTFTLWAVLAPPGTYSLGANLHSGNNYLIIADKKLVPEPSAGLLACLGIAGVAGAIRRRRAA